MTFGNRLKQLRKERGLTQQKIADSLNIKRSLYGAMEEDRTEPRPKKLQELAQLFGLTIDELLSDQPPSLGVEQRYLTAPQNIQKAIDLLLG